MRHNLLALLFPLALTVGCATAPPVAPDLAPHQSWSFPPDAFIRERAVLTAHGRQFTLNGLLARSEPGGLRLVITENFGATLADVLVKRDGTVFVLRSSPMFRPDWIRRFVAADLKGIFGSAPSPDPAVRMLDPTHFSVQRRWYTLDLRIVDTQPGPQLPDRFDETRAAAP